MWIQNILEIHSDNSEVIFFVEDNKKIKNKCTKKEKVLSQLAFELSAPIQFQKSKEGWQSEQCKQWGCIGIHKNASVKFTNINRARYEFKTKQFAPILWLIKVSKIEKYKNITFELLSVCGEKKGFINIKGGIIVCFKELETEFNFCFCENE
jgi:hypothetical protein